LNAAAYGPTGGPGMGGQPGGGPGGSGGPSDDGVVVGRFNTSRLGAIKVKNRAGPVQAFEVLRG